MFNFFRKKTSNSIYEAPKDNDDSSDEQKKDSIISATGLSATEAAKVSGA